MKVFVKAFVSGNFGDDLFVKILCNRYEDHKFYISGKKEYKKFFKEIKNLKYISNDLLIFKLIFKVINKIQYTFRQEVIPMYDYIDKFLIYFCKINVWIAGSIFQEPINREHKINRRTVWNDKYIDRLHIIGSNFGPYKTEQFYEMYRERFEKVGSICFRDRYSYNLFKYLDNVGYATDVIFNLPQNRLKMQDYYVISVIDVYKDNLCKDNSLGKKYIKCISDIINNMTDNKSKVVLLSFCDTQLDNKIIEEIIKTVNKKEYISVKHYTGNNVEEMLNTIKKSKGIIATRFHAMILGLLYEKPVLPIIYDIKMKNVLDDLDFKGSYVDINNIDRLDIDLVNETMKKNSDIDIDKVRNLAKNQFYFLDKKLNK